MCVYVFMYLSACMYKCFVDNLLHVDINVCEISQINNVRECINSVYSWVFVCNGYKTHVIKYINVNCKVGGNMSRFRTKTLMVCPVLKKQYFVSLEISTNIWWIKVLVN